MKEKRLPTHTMAGLATLGLIAVMVAAMYLGRALLVPIALALLFTFLFSPLVARLERLMGRGPAVGLLVLLVFIFMGTMGWVIMRQGLDLMTKLPDYRANIEKKIQAIKLPKESPVMRFSEMVMDVESQLPQWVALGAGQAALKPAPSAVAPVSLPSGNAPVVVADPVTQLHWVVGPLLTVLGRMGIVTLLTIFMLLKREDLRARFIRIVGQGRISMTTRAMEDAGERVSRYLILQLVVNMVFGTGIAAGLFFIGVPNAFLWGALAALLRFIPYIGAPLAALGPATLALAVSPGWEMLVFTLGLFALLELVTANFVEPLWFRSSTGISSLALIVAAIFWAWLWGPVGLILSTPLTVCVAVLGRHVRSLAFLNVLLGNEEALTPSQECYHRLLVGGHSEAVEVVDLQMKAGSLVTLYDEVLIPTITIAETDFQREELQEGQRTQVLQGIRDIVDDLSSRPGSKENDDGKPGAQPVAPAVASRYDCRVACIPARFERDEIAGAILLHLLREHGIDAVAAGVGMPVVQLMGWVAAQKADIVCISALPPWTLFHTRQLCATVRQQFPKLKIMVGIWGWTKNPEESTRILRESGADLVAFSLLDAVTHLTAFAATMLGEMVPGAVPPDEEERLRALESLPAYRAASDPVFDRMTKDLTRTFDVPIALITLIDRDRQLFKSQYGLPPGLTTICELPRSSSVCSHVVAADAPLVVEDLARDRRFANNPMLQQHQLRFYAGVPLHAANGQPVGALCIFDTKPRSFTDAERRMLTVMGEVISEQISTPASVIPQGAEAVAV